MGAKAKAGGVRKDRGEEKVGERERECGRDISRFRLCCCGLRCRFAIMQSDSGRNSRRKERKKSGRGKKEVVEGLEKNNKKQDHAAHRRRVEEAAELI